MRSTSRFKHGKKQPRARRHKPSAAPSTQQLEVLALSSPHAPRGGRGDARTCAGPHVIDGSDSSELSDGPSGAEADAEMDSRQRVRVRNLTLSLDAESDEEEKQQEPPPQQQPVVKSFVVSDRILQFKREMTCGGGTMSQESEEEAEMEEHKEQKSADSSVESEESDDPPVGEATTDEEEKENEKYIETETAYDEEEETKSDDSGPVEDVAENEDAAEEVEATSTTPPPIATEVVASEATATEDAAAEVLSPVQDEKKVTPRKNSASKKRRSLDTMFSSTRTKVFKTHEVAELFCKLYQEQEEDDRSMYDITVDTVRGNTAECERSEEVDELSLEEYRRLLTYGEVSVESVSKTLLPLLQLRPDDVLYDLGCGTGKVLVQALLETKCTKAIGIELMQNRVQMGQRAIDRLVNLDIALLREKTVHIVQGDICKPPEEADITDATVVFINNVMFGPKLMLNIMRKLASLQNVRRIVTLRKICERHRPEKCMRAGSYCADFAPPQEYEITVSWTSKASLYVYQRADSFSWFVDAQNFAYYAQLAEMGITLDQPVRRSSRKSKSPTALSDDNSNSDHKPKPARKPKQAAKPKQAPTTTKVTRKRKSSAKAPSARAPRAKVAKTRKR